MFLCLSAWNCNPIYADDNQVDLDVEIAREQLRALWTAFCVRWNFDSKTFQYESCLSDLYDRLKAHDRTLTNEFSTFEEFNNYMGELIA